MQYLVLRLASKSTFGSRYGGDSMLGKDEFLLYCARLSLPKEAQEYLNRIRSGPPSRRVEGRAGNVTVRYPSRKMGCTIQAESHRNELATIYDLEHDRDVLEFYDQPEPIRLSYLTPSGRQVSPWHTSDYIALRIGCVGWEECKTEEELQRLARQQPNRYLRVDDQWHCPPGERAAEAFGFYYRLRSSAEINWTYQRNIIFLEDYLRCDCPVVSEPVVTLVHSCVVKEPGISLLDLLNATKAEGVSSDDIYTLIATERLFVDIRRFPLAERERVPVFHSEEIARSLDVSIEAAWSPLYRQPRTVHIVAGAAVVWDGKPLTLLHRGETMTSFRGEDGNLVELENQVFETLVKQGKITGLPQQERSGLPEEARLILARARKKDLGEANRHAEAVLAVLAGQEPPTPVDKRKLRNWKSRFLAARQKWGNGYIGLIRRWWLQGNHQTKLPQVSAELMSEYIVDRHEDLRQKGAKHVWGDYVNACEERGIPPASYPTFAAAVRNRPRHDQC